ncbi:MAG: DAK2 domain-containing protein [Lachnospiraceae bacterium]|nr:DAK2 domain-containing protein [Lachnospiraceae bacterium]
MTITHVDGEGLKEAILAGLANLKINKDEVDSLNVFPVPDGDTGTNMMMTLEGGASSVAGAFYESAGEMMKTFSRGVLLGARGNSGVILSQFVKGFAMGVEEKKTLKTEDFRQAFGKGVEKAYEAVIKPTEGTILTVMREGFEALLRNCPGDFNETISLLLKEMRTSLAHTPELLADLKEAGVIDSGGAGFVYIFEGIEKYMKGETIDATENLLTNPKDSGQMDVSAFNADSTLEFGYCTEFILQLQNAKVNISEFDVSTIVDYLETIGNSIVAVKDDDLVKIHVHTFKPGDVLNFCQQFGEYITTKIENMSLQHNETLIVKETKPTKKIVKETAIVACVTGDGLEQYFKEIGVDVIVKGGQTENPSTEDFVSAFGKIEAKTIIVLPCNSNIVMAAEQAAELSQDAKVVVIKAKSVAEGYSALSMIDSSQSAERIIRDMEEAIKDTATGMITTAVRDVDYPDLSVKKGHYIGLNKEKVLSDDADRVEAVRKMLKNTEGIKDKYVAAVFYGTSVPKDELKKIESILQEEFDWLEYGFIYGGQEIYDYIFAID